MKLFFSTEEACAHLGIPKTTLEYYLLEFRLNIKKAGRSRKFSHKDLEKLQKIVDLIQKDGFTIEGTKEKLKQKARTQTDIDAISDRLKEIRNSLVLLRDGIDTDTA